VRDLILDHWPPRNQTETEPAVNHSEPSACELHRAKELAAESLALVNRMEGQPPFGCELETNALDLLAAERIDQVCFSTEIDVWRPLALTSNQLVFKCVQDLSTESLPATGLRLGFTMYRSNQVAPSLVTCWSRSKAESTRRRKLVPRDASYPAARASKFSGIRQRSASSRSTIPARRSASRRRT
jgi:hypothetical protein